MKLFITIEIEKNDIGKRIVSEEAYTHLYKTMDMFREEGIPVQYKETNIPRRYKEFTPLKDLKDIEP